MAGSSGRGVNVEASLEALPLADHRSLHTWLFEDPSFQPYGAYAAQTKYIRARLSEAIGETDVAMALYEALLSEEDTREPLDALVGTAQFDQQ